MHRQRATGTETGSAADAAAGAEVTASASDP